jgi:hypothetical protein
MNTVYVVMRPEDGRRGLCGAFAKYDEAKDYKNKFPFPDELNIVPVDFEPEFED